MPGFEYNLEISFHFRNKSYLVVLCTLINLPFMKTTIRLMLVIAIAFLFSSNAAAQSNKPGMQIAKLTNNFYVYTTYNKFGNKYYGSNSMYVLSEKGAILIDTPWNESELQPLLDSIKRKHNKEVVMCISTHWHDDRTAGLEYYKSVGIKTYTSLYTHQLSLENKGIPLAEFHFEKDTSFHVNNIEFECFYPGAGHSMDNIVIWFPESKVLYGGCLIKSAKALNLGNYADGSVTDWPNSLKRVQERYPNPEFIIPGHGNWKSTKAIERSLKLLDEHFKNELDENT